MVKIKIENILNSEESIIVHQVNVQGVMGGGVAKQLSNHYRNLEKEYSDFCKLYNNNYKELKGKVFKIMINKKFIINMFSQKENFDTDYEAMEEGLNTIKEFAKSFKLSIAIPYRDWLWDCKRSVEKSV